MNQLAVPFNKGYLIGDETGYMHQAMTSGPMTGDADIDTVITAVESFRPRG